VVTQAAGGSLVLNNSSYFVPASIEQRANTDLYICDSTNNPINLGTLKGQTNYYPGLQAGTYKAVVVGSFSDMYGFGSGGSGTSITIPNPTPKQVCEGYIPGYQTQTFQIQYGKTTSVSLGGKLEYNGNKSTFVRYWYTQSRPTTGISAVGIFSGIFDFDNPTNQTSIAIDSHSEICIDGVVTVQNIANPEVALNPGNHTFNSVGYNSLGNSFCDNLIPDLNFNVLANTTYRIFQNIYQIQNLLTGYALNITITDGLTNGANQSGGTVLTFNQSQNKPVENSTQVNNPIKQTQDAQQSTQPTSSKSLVTTTVAGVSETKIEESQPKKDEISLVSNTDLIRTGAGVQSLSVFLPFIFIICTSLFLLSLRKI
jgi:hypothetical protein